MTVFCEATVDSSAGSLEEDFCADLYSPFHWLTRLSRRWNSTAQDYSRWISSPRPRLEIFWNVRLKSMLCFRYYIMMIIF